VILLADESVDRPIIERLRLDGYTVIYISELKRGIPDSEVLLLAKEKNALLLTIDKDFGELVFRRKLISSGVLLIRLEGVPNKKKAEIVSSALDAHRTEMPGSFSVLTSRSIRIRKLDSSAQ